jgi:hypothetical protein
MNTTTRIIDARQNQFKHLLVLPREFRSGTLSFLRLNNIEHSVLGLEIHESYIKVRFFRLYRLSNRTYEKRIFTGHYYMS